RRTRDCRRVPEASIRGRGFRPKKPGKSQKRSGLTGGAQVLVSRAMVSPKLQAQAPLRSLDQRMEALKRANDIRVRRARLKKDLKDGRVRIEQILSNPPE